MSRRKIILIAAVTLALHALRLVLPAILPAAAGFSPIFAAAMFAGATFGGLSLALLTTLALTAAGDLLVQHFVYHDMHGFPIYPGWELVYLSVALGVVAGLALRGDRFSWPKAAGLSVAVIVGHWLLADTGVWIYGGCGADCVAEYTRDAAGFLAVLKAALPTEARLLAATAGFGAAAFALVRPEAKPTEAADSVSVAR